MKSEWYVTICHDMSLNVSLESPVIVGGGPSASTGQAALRGTAPSGVTTAAYTPANSADGGPIAATAPQRLARRPALDATGCAYPSARAHRRHWSIPGTHRREAVTVTRKPTRPRSLSTRSPLLALAPDHDLSGAGNLWFSHVLSAADVPRAAVLRVATRSVPTMMMMWCPSSRTSRYACSCT
jgi:hypothetical protein